MSDARTDEALLTLVDGSPLNAWPIHGIVIGLEKNGLDGWFESADPKYDDPGEMPSQDGGFWPEEVLLQSRLLTVRGFSGRVGRPGSTVGLAVIRDLLASLIGRPLRILVHDEAGPREVSGFVSGKVTHGRASSRAFRFSLIITCPDPIKYGYPIEYQAGSGRLVLENAGSGDVAFIVSTSERITSLAVEYAGDRVEWAGDADGLVLDLADGSPRDGAGIETGYLIAADMIRIPQGQHEVNVTADAPVTLTIRPGWK